MNCLIYFSNDREHVATCQGSSSVTTNTTHALHRVYNTRSHMICGHVYTLSYVSRYRPTSHFNPIANHNTSACGVRITMDDIHLWCSARHKRHNPQGVLIDSYNE